MKWCALIFYFYFNVFLPWRSPIAIIQGPALSYKFIIDSSIEILYEVYILKSKHDWYFENLILYNCFQCNPNHYRCYTLLRYIKKKQRLYVWYFVIFSSQKCWATYKDPYITGNLFHYPPLYEIKTLFDSVGQSNVKQIISSPFK